jgi:hypothetical protein
VRLPKTLARLASHHRRHHDLEPGDDRGAPYLGTRLFQGETGF